MRIKGQPHLSCKELLHSRFSIGRSVWNISGSRQDLVENITTHSSRHCKELFGFLVGGLALAVGAALVDDLLKHQSIFAKASFITTEVRWNWITAGIKTCSSIRCSCRSQARTSPCKCSRAIAHKERHHKVCRAQGHIVPGCWAFRKTSVGVRAQTRLAWGCSGTRQERPS